MTSIVYPVHGVLLVNKPRGPSSNAVLQHVKRIFKAKKAGHSGSLDPMATGMLPICFGEATKFCQYLLEQDKCYEVTACLGVKTTTGDAMGEVTATNDSFCISAEQINAVLASFIGSIQQIPPMYSALKHQGTPLYQWARKGIQLERQARTIQIYNIQLIHWSGTEMTLKVKCSKGTYIRTLVEDIAEQLGVGGHVVQLHRQYTAGFEEHSMVSIEDLMVSSPQELHNYVLPMDCAVDCFPKVMLDKEEIQALQHGKLIPYSTSEFSSGPVGLYLGMQFMGLGEFLSTYQIKAKRLLAIHNVN